MSVPKSRERTARRASHVSEPRALELDKIAGIVADFRQAAENVIAVGFDGVEIHGTNGYLLDQFAKDGANARTDVYGGAVENRARLTLEVTAAVAAQVGPVGTGIRPSPAKGISSSDPQSQFDYVVAKLDELGIAYIHVVEGATGGQRDVVPFDFEALRANFSNSYIANDGYDLELASSRLAEGKADLFAFDRPFIGNPDFAERLRVGAPLAGFNPATLYGSGAAGYTDYPMLAASVST